MPVTYDELITYTVPSNTGSVTLGSGGQGTISQSYTDLIAIVTSKDTRSGSGLVCDLTLRWNGYTTGYNYGVINDAGGFRGSNGTLFPMAHPGNGDQPSTSIWQFSNYTNNRNKQCIGQIASMYGSNGNVRIGTCNNTSASAAITSITWIGEQGIASGSVFKLYGILEA